MNSVFKHQKEQNDKILKRSKSTVERDQILVDFDIKADKVKK